MHHASSKTDWCRVQLCKGFPDLYFVFRIPFFCIFHYILYFLVLILAVVQIIFWCISFFRTPTRFPLYLCFTFFQIVELQNFKRFIKLFTGVCVQQCFCRKFLSTVSGRVLVETHCSSRDSLHHVWDFWLRRIVLREMHSFALFRWWHCLTPRAGRSSQSL